MIIGMDAREIQNGVFTGIGRAFDAFLEVFAESDDENQCLLFSTKPLPREYGRRVRNVVAAGRNTLLWDQWVLRKMIRNYRVDLFFSPYYKIPLLTRCLCVNTIFDLMYLSYPGVDKKMFSATYRWYHRTLGRMMARKARAVFTCSEFSRRDIMSRYGIHGDKIKVIMLGLEGSFSLATDARMIGEVQRKFGIDGRFILYMGNFKPHKNLGRLLEAYGQVRKAFPEIRLVLGGRPGPHLSRVENRIGELGLKAFVRITGPVTDEEQRALYTSAELLAIPSLMEGFGYPPLEAMACGTPVVSSHAWSLPEIVGQAGEYVNPQKVESIAEGICRVLESEGLRNRLVEAGRRQIEGFTLKKTASELYDWIKEVARTQTGNGS